ncbi:hypothetical protein, partial [Cutibacterium modestum]
EQVEGVVEAVTGVGVVAVVGLDSAVGGVEFGQDAVLPSFQHRQWDGSGVDEFFDDGGFELFGFPAHGFALGGDGETFVGAARCGAGSGRYSVLGPHSNVFRAANRRSRGVDRESRHANLLPTRPGGAQYDRAERLLGVTDGARHRVPSYRQRRL